jgi:DNA-binding response OmpR family regulator
MPPTDQLPNVPIIHRPDRPSVGAVLSRPPLEDRKRLMVVDDEVPILRLVTRILSSDNYEIASAESGEAAVRLMEQPSFAALDLLVTDLMMPGINGRELAGIVRQANPQVRVLYVTGFADTLFTGLQELGPGESFIEKPFGAEGLLEATRLLMFEKISDRAEPSDRREEEQDWTDQRLRAKVVRLLRRMRMA